MENAGSSKNTKLINASPQTLFEALTDPEALAVWFAPGEMTAKVHNFDLRVGGGYEMSLFYPESEKEQKGKTAEKEDRYTSRFVEIIPNQKLVQAITFDSDDPAIAGEMIMEVTLEPAEKGTKITFIFKNIPPGINPEDNEEGTELSLEKLARYVEAS